MFLVDLIMFFRMSTFLCLCDVKWAIGWPMNMAKIQKVEKSIVEFNAHQNPRIWPDKGMKRYQNVLNYHEKPILTSETICVMKKKKVFYPSKICCRKFCEFQLYSTYPDSAKKPVKSVRKYVAWSERVDLQDASHCEEISWNL